MKKQIYDEKNGLSYTLHGGYYLPDLEINEEEPIYGKYGIMRKQFLKEHRSARYQYLVLTGKLTEHLNQVDKEVREKIEMLEEQMAEQWGVTEENFGRILKRGLDAYRDEIISQIKVSYSIVKGGIAHFCHVIKISVRTKVMP